MTPEKAEVSKNPEDPKIAWGTTTVSWTHLQLFENGSWWLPQFVVFRWMMFITVPVWWGKRLLVTLSSKRCRARVI